MSGERIKAVVLLYFFEVIQCYLKAHCEVIKHIVILIDGEKVFDILTNRKNVLMIETLNHARKRRKFPRDAEVENK